jgi:Tfp pilus assembly protein PilE
MSSNKQGGFGLVPIVIIVAVLGLLVFAAWRIYDNRQQPAAEQTQTQETAPEVNSANDLQAAEDYLNQQDIDGELDTSELDETLSE